MKQITPLNYFFAILLNMTNDRMSFVRAAVADAVDREGLSDFCRRSGLEMSLVRRTISGGNLTIRSLDLICAALDYEFYIGPKRIGASIAEERPTLHFELSNDDFDTVPLRDTKAAAGDGFVYQGEEVIAEMAFRRDWLRQHQVIASAASLIRIRGESMVPTIFPGDIVLVDHNVREARNNRIAILRIEDRLLCKRLYRLGHNVLVVSDNADGDPNHDPFLLEPFAADVEIVGEVKWAGRNLTNDQRRNSL